MNRKMVFYTTGKILIIEGLLLLLPLFVSIIYGESSWLSFAIADRHTAVCYQPRNTGFC